MKLAPLTLLVVCAAPARADVAVPQRKTWRDGCATRIDEAAKQAGLKPGARASVIPLRREDGTPNPVQYVEYGVPALMVQVGDEPESRPDKGWSPMATTGGGATYFRRLHNRFGKVDGRGDLRAFLRAVDDCLKMGEAK